MHITNIKKYKADNRTVNRDCYNSYFYKVEDDSVDCIQKMKLHGKEFIKNLDGGSALHMNLDDNLSKKQYLKLFDIAAKTGCNYWCTNVKITICNECGSIDKRTLHECSKCHSNDIDYGTRVIGYLKRISSFSGDRQKEESRRFYS